MRIAQASYLVEALLLAGGCSLEVTGLPGPACSDVRAEGCGGEGSQGGDVTSPPGPACGDLAVTPGEACDDTSPFCHDCQLVCPSGWVKSPTTATCYSVFPPPSSTDEVDWDRTKTWEEANTACAAEAPSAQYRARLAGPGVLDVLSQLNACPQMMSGGRGGCWLGARCPGGMRCPDGDALLEWSDRSAQATDAWSSGNPSGDGACIEFIPNEGINDDDCNKEEHYLCEVTLAGL